MTLDVKSNKQNREEMLFFTASEFYDIGCEK